MARTGSTAMRVAPEVAAAYEPVIGLEVHVQLKTATKIFCGCSTRFGDPPNRIPARYAWAFPAPCRSSTSARWSWRCALRWRLNLQVQESSRFARKNYFYPDLPKGYQISMYELPLATAGWLEIEHEGAQQKIGITRLHLEEDAAKNMHEGFPDSARNSYIDYNRGGMPLAEIVSEPDLRSPAEAYAYLSALKQVLEYAQVSDCNMEEGSLRCDANVSVRRRGAERFGTKAEVKNLNSFRYLQRALEYEIERHIAVLESGGRIMQETRLWNVARRPHRAHALQGIRARLSLFPGSRPAAGARRTLPGWPKSKREMPELPAARRARFVRDYGLSAYDAGALTADARARRLFRGRRPRRRAPKSAASWIETELLRRLNDSGRGIEASPVSPAALAALLGEVESGSINGATGKKVFATMFETGKSARGNHRRGRAGANSGQRRNRAPVPRSRGEES